MGLSPRLRGNAFDRGEIGSIGGSIPALAGERITGINGVRSARVYPRACGGTATNVELAEGDLGLSPRLRGNVNWLPLQLRGTGSIPALAGERRILTLRCMPSRVYPRACGGTFNAPAQGVHSVGLSPRLRGNVIRVVRPLYLLGSIPALAGERSITRRRRWGYEVYPRACGGTPFDCDAISDELGLSPRLRGNV